MRWMPTLPLCVPRATLQEDIYNGWHIPRDTLVFINAGYVQLILTFILSGLQSHSSIASFVGTQGYGTSQRCISLNGGLLRTTLTWNRFLAFMISCLASEGGALGNTARLHTAHPI
jgi:hypothetical protein